MATALTVTPKPDVAAVLLEVTGAMAGPLAITRTDVNGKNLVRQMDGQVPISGALTLYDYEAALNSTVTYELMGDSGIVTQTTITSVASPQIMSAVLPHTLTPVTLTGWSQARDTGSTVHAIINRADPIVVSSVLRLRRGSMQVMADSYAEALTVEETAASGDVVLFRQPDFPGMDLYVVVSQVSTAPSSDGGVTQRWVVSLDYTEVASPDGALLSAAGWNFAAMAAGYDTFTDVKTSFTSMSKLTVGP